MLELTPNQIQLVVKIIKKTLPNPEEKDEGEVKR
jgi:hypothetical protein